VTSAAIVDAYSTGRYLAGELARRGFAAVHVQSSPDLPEHFRAAFTPRDFVDTLVHQGDLDRTAAQLAQQKIRFVVPGSEYGVELADLLSERLGLSSNGGAQTTARRNKQQMAETLRKAGVRAVESVAARASDVLVSWARERGRWPVVVKPVDSAGGDKVFFCHDEAQIVQAFLQIVGRPNALGRWNHEVLGQEFLEGTEYFVNTVSVAGFHHIAEIWRYQKRTIRGQGTIYDMEEPVPRAGAIQAELCRYIPQVLDALGIAYGPAHSEVMVTRSGPVLIETGARLAGSILPHAVSRCFGTNHVELTAESYVDPTGFRARRNGPYRLSTNLRYVSLIVPRAANLESLSAFDVLRRLPSFFDMHLQVPEGQRLRATVDSFSSPGYLYLIHADPAQIERDYAILRELEERGLYETSALLF
jgi:biotin carboxylase